MAVYIERRELIRACVGGECNVPLGFVSLTENLMMVGNGGADGSEAHGNGHGALTREI